MKSETGSTNETTPPRWPNLGRLGAAFAAIPVVLISLQLARHLIVIIIYGWPAYADGLRATIAGKHNISLSNGDTLDLAQRLVWGGIVAAIALSLMFVAEKLSGIVPRNLVIAVYALIALGVFVTLK